MLTHHLIIILVITHILAVILGIGIYEQLHIKFTDLTRIEILRVTQAIEGVKINLEGATNTGYIQLISEWEQVLASGKMNIEMLSKSLQNIIKTVKGL